MGLRSKGQNSSRKVAKEEDELWTFAFWDFRNEKGNERKLMRWKNLQGREQLARQSYFPAGHVILGK